MDVDHSDPCSNQASNADTRECYLKNETRANAEADALAQEIASRFRESARKAIDGPVVAQCDRKAANALERSQQAWKAYRTQYCKALMFRDTTGSAAGTEFEGCMFALAQRRTQELQSDFENFVDEPQRDSSTKNRTPGST